MKPRTLQILTALIEDFIETASPVASQRLLMSQQDLDISSATVRNEFATLEEVGLIASPHVSAGKIPTAKGYRFFVDELMDIDKQEALVHSLFEKHITQYHLEKSKESVFDALRVVAQLSGNAAFAVIDNDRTFYIGLSNVLRSPEFIAEPEKAAQIIEILEGRERFQHLLDNTDIPTNDIKIFIGEENLLEEINSCAMLAGRFKTTHSQGKIGIIGPMRMKYGFNKALLKEALQMIL